RTSAVAVTTLADLRHGHTRTWSALSFRTARICACVYRPLENLHQVEIAYGLLLEALHHGFEHFERLALVFHQRIVLPIAAQADSLFQVVHAEEMVFPLRVKNTQHDHALVIAHRIRSNQLLFGVVAVLQLVEDSVSEFLPIERLRLNPFGEDVYTKSREDRIFQPLDVPILGMNFDGTELIQELAKNSGDVIVENELFLINAFEQLAAQTVHRFALLVHHVVIFEQVFAGLEVLRFDSFLGFFNAPRYQAGFDRNTFFHS